MAEDMAVGMARCRSDDSRDELRPPNSFLNHPGLHNQKSTYLVTTTQLDQ